MTSEAVSGTTAIATATAACLSMKGIAMKVEDYLADQGVWFEAHNHRPVYTAQELAAEEHISGKDVAKPVIIKADDGYVMCVLPASSKLDITKAMGALHATQCRLAEENEMATLFPDVEIGAEPPFGNLYKIRTMVDSHLTSEPHILFSAGSHRDAIEMAYADYDRLVHPDVADLSVQV